MWTTEQQETFTQMLCDDLQLQFHLPLISTLEELLVLREAQRGWWQKAPQAIALMIKSGTVSEVWKIYNRVSGGPDSLLTGFSYGDRFVRFVFRTLSFVFWIVFFGGADFAATLVTRMKNARENDARNS